ncbi:MAG: penicillin-binding transpeptidase domain-containing protein, partial [Acutalibacteraceae bacterium]
TFGTVYGELILMEVTCTDYGTERIVTKATKYNKGYLWNGDVPDVVASEYKDYNKPDTSSKPNYSGNYGSGSRVTVQNALARSLNTIPARIIKDMLGVNTSYKYLTEKLGFTTLTDKDNSLGPLSIGSMSYGMTTLEMTAAYCSYGNGGKYYKPYSYYKVTDPSGEVILDNTNNEGTQVFSAETADIMREMMKTVITSSVGTGRGYGVSGFETFAKTGTTDDYKDRWFAGGTPYYFASVWYGYDQPKAINASVNPAGEIFLQVMNKIHKNLADKEFEINGNVVKKYYCPYCGKLASYSTGSSSLGWFDADNLPGYCSGHASAVKSDSSKNSGSATDNDTASNDTNNNSDSNNNGGNNQMDYDIPPGEE